MSVLQTTSFLFLLSPPQWSHSQFRTSMSSCSYMNAVLLLPIQHLVSINAYSLNITFCIYHLWTNPSILWFQLSFTCWWLPNIYLQNKAYSCVSSWRVHLDIPQIQTNQKTNSSSLNLNLLFLFYFIFQKMISTYSLTSEISSRVS